MILMNRLWVGKGKILPGAQNIKISLPLVQSKHSVIERITFLLAKQSGYFYKKTDIFYTVITTLMTEGKTLGNRILYSIVFVDLMYL